MTPFKKPAYRWSILKRACRATNSGCLFFSWASANRLGPFVLNTLTKLNLFERGGIQPKAYGESHVEGQESRRARPRGSRLAEQLPHIFVCGILRSGEHRLPQPAGDQ